jgi:hypothetical protein
VVSSRRTSLWPRGPWRNLALVSPTWIWMQAAVVVFVLAGAIIAIVKLA